MSELSFTLRRYTAADEAAAMELWRHTWQHAYPHLDFTQRLAWWADRWRAELVPTAIITVAERDGAMLGFVTVDPRSGYLDQIVVAPEAWGSAPTGIDLDVNQDNARAIRFYVKHGFAITGAGVNERSGAPLHRMSWRP